MYYKKHMQTEASNLPKDLQQCHAIIVELSAKLREITLLNEKHKQRMLQLLRKQYGQRADKMNAEQLVLWALDELEEVGKQASDNEAEAAAPKKGRRGHGRKPLPKDLPRRQVIHDIAPEEKICSCCRLEKNNIGQEVSEQLEYEPASFYIVEHI